MECPGHDFRRRRQARNRAQFPGLRTREGTGGGIGSQAPARARRRAGRSCRRGSRERTARAKNETWRRKTARLSSENAFEQIGTSLCTAGIIRIKGRCGALVASEVRDRELKSTVRDYGSLSYSRWKVSSKILSDPGSSDLARQLSQVPTKMVTRQWMYPLSLHCRNAISSVRLVTRPRLQISQMVALSPAAIARSPRRRPSPVSLRDMF